MEGGGMLFCWFIWLFLGGWSFVFFKKKTQKHIKHLQVTF